ncbi:MAG: sugar phosphate nucleotidyltransferase [Candidatus Micrarchaeales archaeon]
MTNKYAFEAAETQVAILAGGEAKRMGLDIPKALIKLGDSTLIERCVKLFQDCGFRRFVFLLGYNDKKITEYIDKAKWKRISIKKSYDYAQGIAKGKALKHAIITNKIDTNRRIMVAFPDDIFLYSNIPEKVLKEHLRAVKSLNTLASAVVAKAYRYPYGVVNADENGIVKNFEEKPLVPLLTTTGIYVFEPGVYKYFIDLIDLKKKGPVEFEIAVMPRLAKEGKVYAIKIPPESWIPINTMKDLEQAQKLVKTGKIPK